jgi:hypothetical protein
MAIMRCCSNEHTGDDPCKGHKENWHVDGTQKGGWQGEKLGGRTQSEH